MAQLAAASEHVVVDVGAGDGGYVLHRAVTDPTTFAIALDASPDGLTEGAWRAKRGRVANAAFLVESIERLPSELEAIADEVTVHFPWGSLLRGLLGGDDLVIRNLAALMKDGAELRVLLSATARDGYADLAPADLKRLAAHYVDAGLELLETRAARAEDVRPAHSSWAKRLGAGRPVVAARYLRRPRPACS